MGRGLGSVQRAVIAVFTEDPHAVRSTAELCWQVYGCPPAKRHRVAVLRALRSLSGHAIRHGPRFVCFTPGRVCERGDDLWYNHEIQRPSYGYPLPRAPTRPRNPT
jgi:hypothetical protein